MCRYPLLLPPILAVVKCRQLPSSPPRRCALPIGAPGRVTSLSPAPPRPDEDHSVRPARTIRRRRPGILEDGNGCNGSRRQIPERVQQSWGRRDPIDNDEGLSHAAADAKRELA